MWILCKLFGAFCAGFLKAFCRVLCEILCDISVGFVHEFCTALSRVLWGFWRILQNLFGVSYRFLCRILYGILCEIFK